MHLIYANLSVKNESFNILNPTNVWEYLWLSYMFILDYNGKTREVTWKVEFSLQKYRLRFRSQNPEKATCNSSQCKGKAWKRWIARPAKTALWIQQEILFQHIRWNANKEDIWNQFQTSTYMHRYMDMHMHTLTEKHIHLAHNTYLQTL